MPRRGCVTSRGLSPDWRWRQLLCGKSGRRRTRSLAQCIRMRAEGMSPSAATARNGWAMVALDDVAFAPDALQARIHEAWREIPKAHHQAPNQLPNDADYDMVWALVDSGAARSCARRREHFPNAATELQSSQMRMAIALLCCLGGATINSS